MTAEVGICNTQSLIQFPSNNHAGKDMPDNGTERYLNSQNFPSVLYSSEKDRLKSFENWPNKLIEPKKLAAAGFYYRGPADVVECFKCGIKGHNWLENDNPMEDHMKWNKNCAFVRQNTNNGTTERDNAQQPSSPPNTTPGLDICGNLNVEIHPNSEPEDSEIPPSSRRTEPHETNLERLNFYKATGPSNPDQITFETRLGTFVNWPISIKQKPAELADSGFYYLGLGDQTLCFYCGGGLKDWVPEDDPWEQHAKWFPKCNYLLLKKGPAYVEQVQKAKNEAEAKTATSSVEQLKHVDEPCTSNSCTKDEGNETKTTTTVATSGEKTDEKNTGLCKICYKNEVGIVFVPCGHIVACVDCGPPLKECPVCRKNIELILRAFLS